MACCIENKKPIVLIFKIHNSSGELYICGGGSEKGPSAFFQNGASKYVQGPPIYTCIYMCKVLPYTHVYINKMQFCCELSNIYRYIYTYVFMCACVCVCLLLLSTNYTSMTSCLTNDTSCLVNYTTLLVNYVLCY